VIRDAFPRARGHLLVVPVMHVADYFDLPDGVKAELWALVESARSYLLALYKPGGWTVRINVWPTRRPDGTSCSHPYSAALRNCG
jgi:diadenosine tetraphosphate (Ap4A) HIT family hydrolase